MKREIEPEIMSSEENEVYAKMNFKKLHGWYLKRLIKNFNLENKKLIDIGTGSAHIPIQLAKKIKKISITGIDASKWMAEYSRKKIKKKGLTKKIKIIFEKIPSSKIPKNSYDIILSKVVLHHIKNPNVFWKEIKNLSKPGGLIYIMDLYRPKSNKILKEILKESFSTHQDPLLLNTLEKSLKSAFTISELKKQLKKAGLNLEIEIKNKKYVLIFGTT